LANDKTNLVNVVGAVCLDDCADPLEGLLEAIKRRRVYHLLLDASGVRTPAHQENSAPKMEKSNVKSNRTGRLTAELPKLQEGPALR
jgi:hypothetical protein